MDRDTHTYTHTHTHPDVYGAYIIIYTYRCQTHPMFSPYVFRVRKTLLHAGFRVPFQGGIPNEICASHADPLVSLMKIFVSCIVIFIYWWPARWKPFPSGSPQYGPNYDLFCYEIFAIINCLFFFINFINGNATRFCKSACYHIENKNHYYYYCIARQLITGTL